jgi:3-methyladenine DNA glycosylase AlkD
VATEYALVRAARAGLAELADPVKASGMQRYMKSEMPFRGVQKSARAMLANRLFAEHPLPDPHTWVATALDLWRNAAYREERLLSLDLLGHRAYARWQQPDLLPVYEELIVIGAWWDYVDEIATHRIGPLLRAHPATLAPIMRAWAYDENRWKRRASVICQVSAKHDTDTDLLTACIEATIADRDFFLRKAIGWALRAHAKTDPGWVRAFVDTHPNLSPLSRREATKHL